MADGRVVIDTALDTKPIEQGLDRIEGLLKKSTTNIKKVISTLGLTASAGVLVGKAFGAIKESTESLNDSLAKASTLFGGVQVNMDSLQSKIMALSTETGVAADEIGGALYDALSAGVPVTEDMGEAMDFIAASTKLAKAGFTDVNTAMGATVKTLNAYGLKVDEASRIQNVLIQTQNLGITTVNELGASLAQVTPTAAAFGVEFEQVGAALAAMTAQGTPTTQATTQLNGMIAELGKQSQQAAKNLAEAAEEAGYGKASFADLMEQGLTLNDVLDIMQEYAANNGKSLVDMFGSIEAGKAALSLTSNEGERFNQALEAMSGESDLIDESFNKVIKQSDRFITAVTALGIKIGQGFAPAASKAVGGMADFVSKLAGTVTASGQLTEKLDTLIAHNSEYERVLKGVKEGQEGFTQAMLDSAAAARGQALAELNKAYKESSNEVVNNKKEMAGWVDDLDKGNRFLNGLANQLGVSREELAEMASSLELVGKRLSSDLTVSGRTYLAGGNIDEIYKKYKTQIDDINAAMIKASTDEQKLNADRADLINSLAQAYNSGLDGIDLFLNANSELIPEVMDVALALKVQADQQSKVNTAFQQGANNFKALQNVRDEATDSTKELYDTEEKLTELIEQQKAALEDANITAEEKARIEGFLAEAEKDLAAKIKIRTDAENEAKELAEQSKKTYENAIKDAQTLADTNVILGKSEDAAAGQLAIFEDAINKSLKNGIKPTDENLKKLIDRYKELAEAVKGANSTGYDPADTLIEMYKGMAELEKINKALGKEDETLAGQTKLVEDAIRSMIQNGVDEADSSFMGLMRMLKNFQGQLDGTEDKVKSVGETLKDVFSKKNMADALSGAFSSAMSSLNQYVGDYKQNLADMKDELLKTDEELAKAEEDRAEANEEYANALLSGDQKAIKSAQKRLDQLDESISGMKDLKKAQEKSIDETESGEEAWKVFGKSALNALAEVLEGLGAQLAAQAAIAAFQFRWGTAAVLGVASLAAFGAAMGLRAAAGSFEDGGIVPYVAGVPTTGDRLTANVNPGELILNASQQENVASQLAALAKINDLLSSGMSSGPSLTINLDGSQIWGLDERAVGEAIYHNIKTLQYEGILRKW